MVDGAAKITVGVAGLGAIGLPVAQALASGVVRGMELVAVSANNHGSAKMRLEQSCIDVPILPLKRLPDSADLIVECLPGELFREIAVPALDRKRLLVVVSAAALVNNDDLIGHAERCGARMIVPTGAILGLDAVRAAALSQIYSVNLATRKPPHSLAGAPYLCANAISLEGLTEPKLVFKGTARAAAVAFPANINVAAALALAGIGVDRTEIEVWADPLATRNIHTITVDSDSARFTMTIEGLPSSNPKTSKITSQSVIACLSSLTSSLRVGT